MSYIINLERLSLSKQETYRQQADKMVRTRLAQKLAIPIHSALDLENPALIVREADYVADFIPAATAAGLSGWFSMPMVAVAGVYSLIADNVPAAQTPTVPNNQAWVFYGATILPPDAGVQSVQQLRFGVGAAANRRAQFDLEVLYGGWTFSGYFSQPVWYDPQEIATIQVVARVPTAIGARVHLFTYVAEPIQTTVI
jgi:hypothetical protein